MAFVFLSIVIATYHSCRASNSSIPFIDDTNKTNENGNITYTSNHARRLIYNVPADDFSDNQWKFLKAIALIRIEQIPGNPAHCSGALIAPPPGVQGDFVLTAAHCLYNITAKELINAMFFHVEFGVTANAAPLSNPQMVQCRVDWYRINAKFPIPDDFRNIYDYGIMKLRSCKKKQNKKLQTATLPPPFTIKDWNEPQRPTLRRFQRAGYPGSIPGKRTLRRQDKTEHRTDQKGGRYRPFVILRGTSSKGDSGSPVYDYRAPHKIRAVFSGELKRTDKKIAVKITSDVHEEINQMMKGAAGIPDHDGVKDCSTKYPQDRECWKECGSQLTAKCFNDESTGKARNYRRTRDSPRKRIYIPCGQDRTQKQYLCGPNIRSSAHIDISDEYDEYDDGYNDEYDDEYNDEYGDEYIDDYKKSKNIERIEYEMLLREMGLNDD